MDDTNITIDDGSCITKTANGNRAKCGYCKAQYAACEESTTTPRSLMKCAGCLTAYYCSKEHQRLDWKRHKILCKTIQVKLAAVAAAEAEAQLSHGALVVGTPAVKGAFFGRRRYGSNTQLFMDQNEQHHADMDRAAALSNGNISVESSCRSSTNGSPPNDFLNDSNSASSSVHGSMSDLISQTPHHTAKGGRYSAFQHIGNPKRARFPLTIIRERRSSIGSGEAARLAAAAAGKPVPARGESDSEEEDMDVSFAPNTVIGSGRKRHAAPSSARSSRHQLSKPDGARMAADRSASDADTVSMTRMEKANQKKDHQCNAILDLFTDARFQLDAMVPRHTAFVLRVRRLALCVASALRDYGWCIVDHFLGETHARAIYHETTSLYMTPGLFADGQLMKAAPPMAEPQLQSKNVRSDQIYWFDNRVDRGVHISFLVSMVDSIVYHLTEHIPYRINGRSRAMIACYPGHATKYVRHVDNPDRDGRCVTTIYYLNENWKREHGGTLRIYPESSQGPVDVEPLFDRLLFFWSDRRNPHEVLPAYQNRFAITIWYFDAKERAEALAKEQEQQRRQVAERFAVFHQPKSNEQATTVATEPNVTSADAAVADADIVSLIGEDQRPRGTTRSASCTELSNQQFACGSPSGSNLAQLAQLQQQLRLDSPRQSVVSTGSPQTGIATPNTAPLNSATTTYLKQMYPQIAATAAGHSSMSDYSVLLPQDVIKKLVALTAGRNSSQDDHRGVDHTMARTDSRSSATSVASSLEIDPVSMDK